MKILQSSLPGVSAVYTIHRSQISPFVREQFLCGLIVAVIGDLSPLPVKGGASCTHTVSMLPEGDEHSVTLNFVTHPDAILEEMAFIIVAADGEKYLIGSREAPFPETTVTNSLSTPSEGKREFAVKVVWKGPLIPCQAKLTSF